MVIVGVFRMTELPKNLQDTLLWFLDRPETCVADIDPDRMPDAKHLASMGYLREDRYNPNFRHLLPAYHRDQLFFFLTASGAKAARLVREHRQEGADVEAYRREVLQLQQQLVVIQREAASALENTKNELADYKRQQESQHLRDLAQRELDKKQNRRNLFISAALSVCSSLLIEHHADLVRLAKVAVEEILAFFARFFL